MTAAEIHRIVAAVGKAGGDVAQLTAPGPGTGGVIMETDRIIHGHAIDLPAAGDDPIVAWILTRKRSDTMTEATARTVAYKCRQLTADPDANIGLIEGRHPCMALPIHAPGFDVAHASWHRDAAIRGNPNPPYEDPRYEDRPVAGYAPWVRLTYRSAASRDGDGLRRQWYQPHPHCAWAYPTSSTGLSCDEYPNFATVQSGPPSSRTTVPDDGPHAELRPMPETHNSDEGSSYSAFITSCAIVEGADFLVVPTGNDRDRAMPFPVTARACSVAE